MIADESHEPLTFNIELDIYSLTPLGLDYKYTV